MQEIVISFIRTSNSRCVILLEPQKVLDEHTYIVATKRLFPCACLKHYIDGLWNIHGVKKMIADVRYVFVPAYQGRFQDHTTFLWLLSEPMPFGGCLWGFDIVLLASSKSRTPQLEPDWSQCRARSSGSCWYTYIDGMLDILIVKLKWWKKVEGLTWSCTATEWMYKHAACPE